MTLFGLLSACSNFHAQIQKYSAGEGIFKEDMIGKGSKANFWQLYDANFKSLKI